jgi:hypothetical protein
MRGRSWRIRVEGADARGGTQRASTRSRGNEMELVSKNSLPVLRGRDAELAVLGRRLDDQRYGRGGVILIRGAAGLGKSALLVRAEEMAKGTGARICHGDGDSADQAIPLARCLMRWRAASTRRAMTRGSAISAARPISATGYCGSSKAGWRPSLSRDPLWLGSTTFNGLTPQRCQRSRLCLGGLHRTRSSGSWLRAQGTFRPRASRIVPSSPVDNRHSHPRPP